eukprot:6486036-Amphidinium_carterae.1
MVPSNGLQTLLTDQMDELPYVGQWHAFEVGDEMTVSWSSEDIRCAFYVFKLPRCWRRWMVLRDPIEVDGHKQHIALAVIPMGWISAVIICQHIHKNILLGARLPVKHQLRRGHRPPHDEKGFVESYWQ